LKGESNIETTMQKRTRRREARDLKNPNKGKGDSAAVTWKRLFKIREGKFQKRRERRSIEGRKNGNLQHKLFSRAFPGPYNAAFFSYQEPASYSGGPQEKVPRDQAGRKA